jgi:uncharacterized protein
MTDEPSRHNTSGRDVPSAETFAPPGADGAHANRLIREKSPYLLQHARNPVDWFPWGEEAFAKARRERKPLFLSVGYSTCHWCHVMERESFENPEVARLLNAYFISIKVDREERPDVDRMYMAFVQATTGGGGWPMSVWLTPDLKPFYGGSYYPPEDRRGHPGFKSVLLQIAEAWKMNPALLTESGDVILRHLQEAIAAEGPTASEPGPDLLEQGYREIQASYDPRVGGFGGAPKFPRPATLHFLLRYHARPRPPRPDRKALEMALHTLRKMAEGGIHDHLGGGFHRYSVDESWHVPHFEKMLYDQAQLANAYLDAYQITRDPFHADMTRDILEYVLRDMTGKDGRFFSAEDADSPRPNPAGETAEGAFYVWEHGEINRALGESAGVFNYHYGVEPAGNVRNDPYGEFRNQNILIARHELAETARTFGKTTDEIRALLVGARGNLFGLRTHRTRPACDDKTITAWNGLMISALARATQALNEPRYREAAEANARFIATHLFDPNTGTLLRRFRAGQSAIAGYAEDYAFLIQGLLDLYGTTFEASVLAWAVELQNKQNDLFWDAHHGGYFGDSGQDPGLPLRLKEDSDGAEPSANSIAALNLLRLARLIGNEDFQDLAERTLAAFHYRMQLAPSALPQMLATLIFHLDPPLEIVIAGSLEADDTRAMLREIHARFIPNKIVRLVDGDGGPAPPVNRQGSIQTPGSIDGNATAYICAEGLCHPPTRDLGTLIRQLEAIAPAP